VSTGSRTGRAQIDGLQRGLLFAQQSAILEQLAEGVIVTDAAGRIIFVNEAAERLHGVKSLDVAPDDYSETYHLFTEDGRPHPPKDLPLARAVLRGETVLDARWRIRRPDGSEVLAIGSARPLAIGGERSGAILTLRDDTERHAAEEALRQSEERVRLVLDAATDYAIFTTDPERRIASWSRGAEKVFGYSPEEAVGMPADLLWTDEDREAAQPEQEIKIVRERGCAEDIRWHLRRDGALVFLNGSMHPLPPHPDGSERGFIKIARDETARLDAELALKESEERFRLLANTAPALIWTSDAEANINFANHYYYETFGRPADEMLGDGWTAIVHPDDLNDFFAGFMTAFERRETYRSEVRVFDKVGAVRWLSCHGSPQFDGSGQFLGYTGVNLDITDRKLVEAALQDASRRLDSILNNTRMAIFMMDDRQQCVFMNKAAEDLTGYSFAETQGRPLHDVIHNKYPDGRDYPLEECPIDRALPEDDQVEGEELFVHKEGYFYPVGFTASPIRDQAGNPIGTIIEARSIAEEKARDAALHEERRTLETLNQTGAALAGELDLERVVQMVTDAGVDLTGAQFGAFFYNVVNEAGESLMLFTLSGAHASQFDFGMPRATAIFHPTFTNEGTIRSDDITADPRYGLTGPHHGMPKGHLPVRSYLAVSVISRSGEVIGGLFFGHPEPARFTERHERLIVGIASQAAVAIDNARLYQAAQQELAERQRAEERLRELNETLEQRVSEEVARRAEAEEALRQAQKMETLGQLTGGVAHDFNNLLQIVTGNLEILQRKLTDGDARLRRSADNAMKGAERAAILTQRLLAFSRRQPLEPRPIELNKLVSGMSELLHRTLGETIAVETVLASGLWRVEADPNQLENAILNLAVNARDAMPEGGKLTIETSNTHFDDGYAARNMGVMAGQYVAISVSDTGLGMSTETLERVFEPFFTTKDVGKGTGLGLSMVYGFVKQSGGHVKLYSEPGEGTTVRIYLPRLRGTFVEEEEAAEPIVPEGTRGETILVCEDDDDVRAYSVEVLRELGYRVLEAHDAASALRLLERQGGEVDLLFTDIVLPGGMMGNVLAEQARAVCPDLKVLFTTGYARNAVVHHGRLDPGVELVTKPFTYADLAARIRDLLDARG